MKSNWIFFSTLIFTLVSFQVFGQTEGEVNSRSQCENYNAFLDSDSFEDLELVTQDVFPSGIMKFNTLEFEQLGGFEGVTPYLNLDNHTTFELSKVTSSALNQSQQFFHFQQYYKGVKVDGSGYSRGGGGGGGSPCDVASLSLSPYISTGIDLDVNPSVNSDDLGSILDNAGIVPEEGNTNLDNELVITPNVNGACEYTLTWKTHFSTIDGNKTSWIDAKTGNILKTMQSDDYHTGGERGRSKPSNLEVENCKENTFCPDGPIFIVDVSNVRVRGSTQIADCGTAFVEDEVESGTPLCPIPPDNSIAQQVADRAQCIVDAFENLTGSTFEKINIGIGGPCDSRGITYSGSNLSEINLTIGEGFEDVDVIGHEITHGLINEFFTSSSNGVVSRSLHEGIADMFGEYADEMCNGGADFETIGTDFNNLQFPCFSDVHSSNSAFDRKQPLLHWFSLISNGIPDQGIAGIGIQKAMEVVFDGLNTFQTGGDFREFMYSTINAAEEAFGPLSDEVEIIKNAWEKACVKNVCNDCDYTIDGVTYSPCEENNELLLHVGNPASNGNYRWTFPLGWSVANSNGNSFNGTTLNVTGFPTYNYYPQHFRVCVYAPEFGSEHKKCTRITIRDCDGDDPTCEEYYNSSNGGRVRWNGHSQTDFKSVKDAVLVRVFDSGGKLLIEERFDSFDKTTIDFYSNFVFISYFDKELKLIFTEKIFNHREK